MPLTQSAVVANHDVGLPAVAAAVAIFSSSRGGLLEISLENADGAVSGTVSLQVSADGVTYANASAAANGQAIANVVIKPGTRQVFAITLREGQDNFLQIYGSGGVRLQAQFRGNVGLQLVLM